MLGQIMVWNTNKSLKERGWRTAKKIRQQPIFVKAVVSPFYKTRKNTFNTDITIELYITTSPCYVSLYT